MKVMLWIVIMNVVDLLQKIYAVYAKVQELLSLSVIVNKILEIVKENVVVMMNSMSVMSVMDQVLSILGVIVTTMF